MHPADRFVCLVALLGFSGCMTSWESSYRPTSEEVADIYTAAIRFRLMTEPLAAHRQLDIFLNLAVVPGLPARLSEYQVRVRRGGSDPRAQVRWYWLHLGRVTSDKAFVEIRGARAPERGLELRKRAGVWIVVAEERLIITYDPQTPNHAMERTATLCAFTFRVAWTSSLRSMCALGGRRSSYSR
jgi:hypothetical protein